MPGRISHVVANLILEGLRRVLPEALEQEREAVETVLAATVEDGVPLAPYRQVLRRAFALDGGVALLRAGETVRHLQHPLLFVLLNSDSPRLLIDKEARLANFIHSRHQVIIEEETPDGLLLRHGSAADPPEPTENLASCGQHLVVLEEIGCQGLTLTFPNSAEPDLVVYDDGRFTTPSPGGGYDLFRLQWSGYAPSRKPMPGLDEMLLSGARERELREDEGLLARVEEVVRRDLGRTWRISDVAADLGTSPRSLQRNLAALGERYSDAIDRIRNAEAARLLRESELSITEIGYVCGFADSAHFSRSFKKRFGAPPSVYRNRA